MTSPMKKNSGCKMHMWYSDWLMLSKLMSGEAVSERSG